MKEKILFLKWGSFSLINDSIYNILKTEFGEYDIEVIDLSKTWKKKIGLIDYAKNITHFIGEYGGDFLKGHKKRSLKNMYGWFHGTSYMVSKLNGFIQQQAKGKTYKFTFQTQTLFNGKIKGIPHFIYTDHTTQANLLYPDINAREYIRSNAFIKKIEQKIYEHADMVFTCGSLISYSVVNQYHIPKEKVMTVYAGSNISSNYTNNEAKYATKNILFVGIDWYRKGGPMLLKAFDKVLEKHTDAKLTIIGCSPKEATNPNCNVVGRIPKDKLPGYYNDAALFCLPTLREPFGIVFVEAMHYRLPIVANNIGSISDMVINNYNGYLCKNTVDEYADAICKLLEDAGQCKQMGENGYQHAESKFRWELVGKTMKKEMVNFL